VFELERIWSRFGIEATGALAAELEQGRSEIYGQMIVE
jgi:hypothetical protein